MARKDQTLKLFNERIPKQFGGVLLRGNAKVKRPLSTKHGVHLVLKSELARGAYSFLGPKNVKQIDAIIRQQAKVFDVRLYQFVNVGNHLHLVLRLPKGAHPQARRRFFSFVRAATGLIARHVLGAQRNAPKNLKFWQARPFTRLVTWGRDFHRLNQYMEKNRTQARARVALVDWGFGILDPLKIANLNTS